MTKKERIAALEAEVESLKSEVEALRIRLAGLENRPFVPWEQPPYIPCAPWVSPPSTVKPIVTWTAGHTRFVD